MDIFVNFKSNIVTFETQNVFNKEIYRRERDRERAVTDHTIYNTIMKFGIFEVEMNIVEIKYFNTSYLSEKSFQRQIKGKF